MLSRARSTKQFSPQAVVSPQAKHSENIFSAGRANEAASPVFAYSLDGVRTFAEGENHHPWPAQGAMRPRSFFLQTKLAVGATNDPLEREADSIAEQVVRMHEPGVAAPIAPRRAAGLRRKCDCGGTCEDCRKESGQEAPVKVQMKAAGHGVVSSFSAPAIVDEVLHAPGEPLDTATREFMEPRFGYDFSQVRIHKDGKAGQSVQSVNAKAYTVGNRIVFDENQYAPHTQQGQNLLAHELAHAVQQGGAEPGNDRRSQSRRRPALSSAVGLKLQRQGQDLSARLNDALSRSDWDGAARALTEMPESDARAALTALNSTARARLRAAALNIDPSPSNRVAQLIDSIERESRHEAPPTAPAATASQDLSSLGSADKLGRAWGYARGAMADEARRALQDLFSPSSLAIMAGFVVAYIAAQLTPVGWVADAIALASLSVAAIFMGRLLFDIIEDLYTFFSAVNATSDAELREAGRALARAVARGGVQIVVLLLTRSMRGGRGSGSAPPRVPPPSGAAEIVTTQGFVVRVPPEAVPELPQARFSGQAPSPLQRGPLPEPRTVPRPTTPGRPVPGPEVEAPASPSPPTAAGRPGTGRPTTGAAPSTRPQLGEGRLPQTLPQPVPVLPRRGGARGTMRHQIQRGDDHHASLGVTATTDQGVTARQLRDTMAVNFRQYMDIARGVIPVPRGWVRGPVDWEGPIRSAIIAQSQAIDPIVAAGGITQGGDINALRRCFDPNTGAPSGCASNDVRLDVENRGHNLRS
jgi:hypothetical protein